MKENKTNPRWASAFKRASEIQVKKLEWLIEPFLAIGESTVIAGEPGVGKTTLATLIGSALLQGKDLDGKDLPAGPQKVMVLDQRGFLTNALINEVRRNGGNAENLLILDADNYMDGITLSDPDLIALAQQCDIGTIIVDPLLDFAGEYSLERSGTIQSMLSLFMRRARKAGISVLGTIDAEKPEKGYSEASRACGPEIVAVSFRSAFMVYPPIDKDNTPNRWVMLAKGNLPINMSYDPMAWEQYMQDGEKRMRWIGKTKCNRADVIAGTAGPVQKK